MTRLLAFLPSQWRRTVAFDNAGEYVLHHQLNSLGIETFFCDTHSPWQRGGVENANGRLRRYLPRKGETLSGDGSVSGQWAAGCDSGASGRGYAQYYTFTLTQESDVTVTLESTDADTYLYLREGEARSGDYLYQNDDDRGTTSTQSTVK